MLVVKARGVGSIDPPFLSQLDRVSGQLHVPAVLSAGNEPPILNTKLEGAPNPIRTFWEMSDVFPLPGI